MRMIFHRPTRDHQALGLWKDYRVAVADIDRAASVLNQIEAPVLAGYLAADGNPRWVSLFLSTGATVDVRSRTVGLILRVAAYGMPGQKALFAALGSVGARRVRPELPALVEAVCAEHPDENDQAGVLNLLWNYRQFGLLGTVLAWLLAHEDPGISATASDFLDEHEEARDLINGRTAPTPPAFNGRVITRPEPVVVPEAGEDLRKAWAAYCKSRYSLSQAVGQILSDSGGDIVQRIAVAGKVKPRECGRFLAPMPGSAARHVIDLVAGRPDEVVRGVFAGIADEVSVNAAYAADLVTYLPHFATDGGLAVHIEDIRSRIRSTYGEFDRFGWLTEPRE